MASHAQASTSAVSIIHGKPFTRRNSTFQVNIDVLSWPCCWFQRLTVATQLVSGSHARREPVRLVIAGALLPLSCVFSSIAQPSLKCLQLISGKFLGMNVSMIVKITGARSFYHLLGLCLCNPPVAACYSPTFMPTYDRQEQCQSINICGVGVEGGGDMCVGRGGGGGGWGGGGGGQRKIKVRA